MFLFLIIIKLACILNQLILIFGCVLSVLETVLQMKKPEARKKFIYLILTVMAEILTIALILNA